MSLQPLVDVGESRRNLSSMYAPIAAELAEAERIFQDELGSRFPFVQQLVDHCADYRANGCGRRWSFSRERRAARSPTLMPFWRPSLK